eukprot:TRINITY_DN21488_c0_g1_i2.p1 TRINITY_DN21488_c0_g1~~TRINITY_DN21488_c0_g1_i2.p1  ORF type:complete len:589 (-),score=85.45 TRINITY_DN21488_c0_g1_i2:48-1814(-)
MACIDTFPSHSWQGGVDDLNQECQERLLSWIPPQVQLRRSNIVTDCISDWCFERMAKAVKQTVARRAGVIFHRRALDFIPPQVRIQRANIATDRISDRDFEKACRYLAAAVAIQTRSRSRSLDRRRRKSKRMADPFEGAFLMMKRFASRASGGTEKVGAYRKMFGLSHSFSATCQNSMGCSDCRTTSATPEAKNPLATGWIETADAEPALEDFLSGVPMLKGAYAPSRKRQKSEVMTRPGQKEMEEEDKELPKDPNAEDGREEMQKREAEAEEEEDNDLWSDLSSSEEQPQKPKIRGRFPSLHKVCEECREQLASDSASGKWLRYSICPHRLASLRGPLPPKSYKLKKPLRQTHLARVRRGEAPRKKKRRKAKYPERTRQSCPHGFSSWRQCGDCKAQKCCPHGKPNYGNCCAECRGCTHGRLKVWCVDCNPCEHGKVRLSCPQCRGGCPHGRLRRFCPLCAPCPHGVRKDHCKDCSGCIHGKLASNCKHCSGCPHGKVKRFCPDCTPCPHGRRKQSCKDCSVCPHGKIRDACNQCKSCPHGKVRRFCRFCNGCEHGQLLRFCKFCTSQRRGSAKEAVVPTEAEKPAT